MTKKRRGFLSLTHYKLQIKTAAFTLEETPV